MLNITEYKKAEKVFSYFEEISKIPRISGNTSKIADYLTEFAKTRGLSYIRDESDNVIIRKKQPKAIKITLPLYFKVIRIWLEISCPNAALI